MTLWSNETERAAVELWDDGKSSSQIAAILWLEHKLRVTRSAVLGKLHRIGKMRSTQLKTRSYPTVRKKPGPPPKLPVVTWTSNRFERTWECQYIDDQGNKCLAHSVGSWCEYHKGIVYAKREPTLIKRHQMSQAARLLRIQNF